MRPKLNDLYLLKSKRKRASIKGRVSLISSKGPAGYNIHTSTQYTHNFDTLCENCGIGRRHWFCLQCPMSVSSVQWTI